MTKTRPIAIWGGCYTYHETVPLIRGEDVRYRGDVRMYAVKVLLFLAPGATQPNQQELHDRRCVSPAYRHLDLSTIIG